MFKLEEKIILTDCDGVLLDWEKAFIDWMTSKGYEKKVNAVYDIDVAFDLPRNEGKRLVKEFNESAWMGFLPALRDSRSGVAALVEAGYRFVVITSLSTDPMAKRLRWMNLNDIFGRNVFVDLICLDTGADKDEALEVYEGTGSWWLEDKSENAMLGANMGLRSVLVDHPHNQDVTDSRIKRLGTWKEIAAHIITEDSK
jgi:FMN phosphatase YigB (HAD superfamily)